jgi:7-keto-8-aminopelargonate synthetase-like enzyme
MSAIEDLNQACHSIVKGIQDAGLGKIQKVVSSPQGVHLEMEGQKLLNFSTTDYFGFCNNPEVCFFKRTF